MSAEIITYIIAGIIVAILVLYMASGDDTMNL